jgi:FkbM family methyltransferase
MSGAAMRIAAGLRRKLEDLSFRHRLVRRRVSLRGAAFRVYAWHPLPWDLPDVPPTSWLLDDVGPGSVVFDVGANRGYVALALLARVPGLRLVAFEPNPGVLTKLTANLRLNGFADRAQVLGLGLGEYPARVPLFVAASDTASSLDDGRAARWGVGIRASVEVDVVTLDALVAAGRVPPPTHIKVDTEGFEAQVLRGARDTLRTHRPALYLEIHADGQGIGDNREAILAALSDHGYQVSQVGNQLRALPASL